MKRTCILMLAAGALLGSAGCDRGTANEVKILPVTANLAIDVISPDPGVYFVRSPMDTTSADDIVVIDVVLRDGAAPAFDAFTLEVMFDPGLVQIDRIVWNATPLGDCTATTGTCNPVCANNVAPSPPTVPANTSGDLLIGVGLPGSCPGASNPGPVTLLTLWFNATTVGTSQIKLVDGAGSGDCEILAGSPPASLGIPCYSANATLVAAR